MSGDFTASAETQDGASGLRAATRQAQSETPSAHEAAAIAAVVAAFYAVQTGLYWVKGHGAVVVGDVLLTVVAPVAGAVTVGLLVAVLALALRRRLGPATVVASCAVLTALAATGLAFVVPGGLRVLGIFAVGGALRVATGLSDAKDAEDAKTSSP